MNPQLWRCTTVAVAGLWSGLLLTVTYRYFVLNRLRGAFVWAAFGCFLAAADLEWS